MRKNISKKVRFDVFKRDSFSCQYCGRVPPVVVLEIDHITPVRTGGDNHIDNLITSCFDCNRGKGGNELDNIPDTLIIKSEVIKEREEQIKEYKKLQNKVKLRINKEIDEISEVFERHFPGFEINDLARDELKIQFLSKLDVNSLIEYMGMACIRVTDDPAKAYKYFCGICWNIIKGKAPRKNYRYRS